MLRHALAADRLIEGEAQHRQPGCLPGVKADPLQLRTLGNEAVYVIRVEAGTVECPGSARNGHRVARCRTERVLRIELAGERQWRQPAPVAFHPRLDAHRDDHRCRRAERHHRPVKVNHQLMGGRDILTGGRDALDAQRLREHRRGGKCQKQRDEQREKQPQPRF